MLGLLVILDVDGGPLPDGRAELSVPEEER
jgi:hypothetical protein